MTKKRKKKTLLTVLPKKDVAAEADPPSSNRRDYVAIANRYARQIVSGEIPACRQVIQACQRHLNDLDRQLDPDFEFELDPASASRWCEFLEALPHVKGKWAAKRETLTLEPWQCFIIVSIAGWVEKLDHTRYRFHDAYIEVPRKNGKSFFGAGIGDYKFCADNEYSAEVYFGATSEEQAKRLGFKPARAMVLRSPAMRSAFGIKVYVNSLVKEDDGSILKAVIAKPGDGDSPSCVIIDEYHEHPTSELYDCMKTGMAARENPLIIVITTAGSNRGGPCYLMHLDVEKLLAGTLINERQFGIIYTIDPEDDWKSESALIKTNPNYGVSIEPRFLRDELAVAIQSSRRQNAFKMKYENIWTNAAVGWMNMESWKSLSDPSISLDQFAKRPCVEAFDLASRIDIASKVRAFQRLIAGKAHYYVFAKHFLNQAAIDDGRGEHYAKWVKDGWLTATPGNITDYVFILEDVVAGAARFNIRGIAYDPFHADPLVQFIQADRRWNQSVPFVEVSQSTGNMSPAMKELEALVMEGRIHHDGDPVLEWMMSNVVAVPRPHDCIVPDKERPELKIDAAIALLMAIAQAPLLKQNTGRTDVMVI
jgi:phage terminase large subunit-like protein